MKFSTSLVATVTFVLAASSPVMGASENSTTTASSYQTHHVTIPVPHAPAMSGCSSGPAFPTGRVTAPVVSPSGSSAAGAPTTTSKPSSGNDLATSSFAAIIGMIVVVTMRL
ncbi:hypothetical protein BGZ76_010419 [Entomortierella beljakovae]|nr:hypothetical protein BGZ76_010419 [Entomortierella beljakovae]